MPGGRGEGAGRGCDRPTVMTGGVISGTERAQRARLPGWGRVDDGGDPNRLETKPVRDRWERFEKMEIPGKPGICSMGNGKMTPASYLWRGTLKAGGIGGGEPDVLQDTNKNGRIHRRDLKTAVRIRVEPRVRVFPLRASPPTVLSYSWLVHQTLNRFA